MKLVPISGKINKMGGRYFWVDDEDYAAVSCFRWYQPKLDTQPRTTLYIGRRKTRGIGITAILMGTRDGYMVDHIDRNNLNNTRENLRWSTYNQNNANRRKQIRTVNKSKNQSKYKGVTWYKASRPWTARIMVGRTRHFLGYFSTEEEAARQYDVAAKKLHGEFAVLNFPEASRG